MGLLSFTKEELITLKNGIQYLPDSLNLSISYIKIIEKINYMLSDIDRQEKTSAKFAEWNRQLLEQKNE